MDLKDNILEIQKELDKIMIYGDNTQYTGSLNTTNTMSIAPNTATGDGSQYLGYFGPTTNPNSTGIMPNSYPNNIPTQPSLPGTGRSFATKITEGKFCFECDQYIPDGVDHDCPKQKKVVYINVDNEKLDRLINLVDLLVALLQQKTEDIITG